MNITVQVAAIHIQTSGLQSGYVIIGYIVKPVDGIHIELLCCGKHVEGDFIHLRRPLEGNDLLTSQPIVLGGGIAPFVVHDVSGEHTVRIGVLGGKIQHIPLRVYISDIVLHHITPLQQSADQAHGCSRSQ